jgi:cytochrome oxidase Cu insertion factor (SCO1/SenC/PrrC family)
MLRRRAWLAAGLAGMLLAGATAAVRAQAPDYLLKEGETAPDFTLKTPDDRPVTLSELTKKNVVLVNFWFVG